MRFVGILVFSAVLAENIDQYFGRKISMEHVNADNELANLADEDKARLEEIDDIDLSLVGGGAFPFIQTA